MLLQDKETLRDRKSVDMSNKDVIITSFCEEQHTSSSADRARPQYRRSYLPVGTESKFRSWRELLLGNTQQKILHPGPTPDGGLQAWLQVALAFITYLAAWSFSNSFGIFVTYYSDTMTETQSNISWVGSVQNWTIFAVSVLSGRALDAGLFYPTFLVGSLLQTIGTFTTSQCKNLWQLVLAQGLCTGIGCGMVFCPAVGIVTTYFEKNRGLAVAIVSCGSSVGGGLYPIIVRLLLPQLGFAWTLRVLGFINIACLAISLAFLRPRLPPRNSGPIVEWRAFREVPYACTVMGMALTFGGIFFTLSFLGSYGHDIIGMSYAESTNLLLVFNVVGIPARLLIGWIADKYTGPLNGMVPLMFLNCVCGFAWTGVKSRGDLYALTSVYGLTGGAYQALFATTLTCLNKDLAKNGVLLGMALSVFSFSSLLAPPAAGALLQTQGGGRGGYLSAQVATGLAAMVGTCLMIYARVHREGWSIKKKC